MKQTLFLALLIAAAPQARASVALGLDPAPSPALVQVGDTLTLNVDIFTTDNVFGFQFDLLYPNFLTLSPTGISEEGYFFLNSCCFNAGAIDNANGIDSGVFDVISGPNGLSGFDTLVQFQFQVTGIGTGQFDLATMLFTDDSFNSLQVFAPTPVDVTSSVGSPIQPPEAPEPATAALAAFALAVFAVVRRRGRSARHVEPCD